MEIWRGRRLRKSRAKFQTRSIFTSRFPIFLTFHAATRWYNQTRFLGVLSFDPCICCSIIDVRCVRIPLFWPSSMIQIAGANIIQQMIFSAGAMVARKTSTVNNSRHLEALGSSPRWRVSGLNPQALSDHLFFLFCPKWFKKQRNSGGS